MERFVIHKKIAHLYDRLKVHHELMAFWQERRNEEDIKKVMEVINRTKDEIVELEAELYL